jgi:tRNA(Ile)-lysidine synthase
LCNAKNVIARIARTIDRYRMFADAKRIGVAVSGGADSVCLLQVLRELAPQYGVTLSVLHLDHGLRGADSCADAAFVRELAQSHGLPVVERALDLTTVRGNLEQEGRRARLEFFSECIASGNVDRVATGHTQNDQAETVLFRMMRGSGSAGLAGIRPSTKDGLIRPLIEIGRDEVVAYLRERDLTWREDATNQSPDFARNRIRHSLLPQLQRDWNPEMVRTLSQMADWAREEESWWQSETERLAACHFTHEAGAVLVRASVLDSLPRAAARRLVRCAVETVRGDLRAVSFGHVEAVLDLAGEMEGGYTRLPGVTVCRSFDWVRFAHPEESPGWRLTPRIPSRTKLPGSQLWLSLEIIDKSETSGHSHYVYNIEMGCLDWKRLSNSPVLRNWQPGDRYQPMGSSVETKLKNLFQEARVPVWQRVGWPVLEVGGRIAWARRFGAAAWCAAQPDSTEILRVCEIPR